MSKIVPGQTDIFARVVPQIPKHFCCFPCAVGTSD